MSGKGSSFGAFLDSTLDRMEEGIVLTAVAFQFSQAGNDAAVAAVRRRGARLADGVLHARPRRGARRRVQGRDRRPRGARRDPVGRPACSPRAPRSSTSSCSSPPCGCSPGCPSITVGPAHLPRPQGARRARPGAVTPTRPAGSVTRTAFNTRGAYHLSTNGSSALPGGEGPRRHHRRRQLRLLLRPGRPVLQGRRSGRAGPGPHARRPRRLPRPRHRVLGRVRHRRREGRQGPLRGDLRRPEQHARTSPARSRSWASRSSAA